MVKIISDKKKIIGVLSVLMLFIFVGIIFAEDTTTNDNGNNNQNQEQKKEEILQSQKERAIAEIDRRVTSLNQVIEKINGMKRITQDQKSILAAQVQAEIDSLTQLKDKINADTDKATLLADKKSIVQKYRIYALFQPKIRIMAQADQILELADLMDARTDNADAKTKIADAKIQAQKAIDTVTVLTPEGYPGNKPTLLSAVGMLQAARQDLNVARVAMKQNPTPTN
ncbi:MAG: hypothetical protein WC520_01390 [Candidatus Paceibacterota bacterium]